MSRYRTIVADPPWQVAAGPGWDSGGRTRPLNYPTMTVQEIAALPVQHFAEADAHLYLWTINKYIPDTYTIARAWGFQPSTLLTWCKHPNGLGLGGAWSLTTEHVLYAHRGRLPARSRIDTTWWLWKRGGHSQKPDAFQDLVEQVSPGPYLEMFARRQRLGWDTWGNQALCHIDMDGVTGD